MRFSFAPVIVLGLSGVAAAQPTADAPPTTDQPVTPPPTDGMPPAPPPPPVAGDLGDRPTEIAFGLGIGYIFPTSLESPNVTSARVRFTNGIQIEPRIVFGNTDTSTTTGAMTTSTGSSEVQLAGLVRVPLITHKKIDFELIGALDLDLQRTNPDGDNNNTSDTTIALSWGIGLGYWFSPHWNMSFTATNALISFTEHKQEIVGGENKTSTTSFGAIFSPQIGVMIHLFD
jgi:hypothetical protein